MTETTLRKRARELLKPLFLRPCSVEERAVCDAVESFIERQQQVIDLLMKAVEPFSDAATIYDTAFLYQGDIGILPDSSDVSDLDARFTVGDLRRAREAKLEAEKILNSTPSTAL